MTNSLIHHRGISFYGAEDEITNLTAMYVGSTLMSSVTYLHLENDRSQNV